MAADAETTMFRMVWDGAAPAVKPEPEGVAEAVPLRPHQARQALQLAELCKPGPFGIRTIELGDYFGYFDGERLMAMAGEHVMRGNPAHQLYLDMGFKDYLESTVRVVVVE